MATNILSSLKHYKLQTLANGIYAAIAQDGGAAISNSGIIDLGELNVIFDTSLTPTAAKELRSAALTLTGRNAGIVINSHHHNDHVWGNQVFLPESVILSTKRTYELMLLEGKKEIDSFAANTWQRLAALRQQYDAVQDPQKRYEISLWVAYYQGIATDLPDLKLSLPQITVSSPLELRGRGQSLHLIPFEGAHSESDMIAYLPKERIVFASDILFVNCHAYLGDGDPEKLLAALRSMQELDAITFVPGHGAVGGCEDLQTMIDYVQDCMQIASDLKAKNSGPLDETIEFEIPTRYQDWQQQRFFQANIRALYKIAG